MKKALICILIVFLISCVNKDGMTSQEFKNVSGILYYEKPETGAVVNIVFLPFYENDILNSTSLHSKHLKKGIKFGTANSLIKDQLYSFKSQKVILKGSLNRTVYLVCNVKIYFHIERTALIANDVIDKDVQTDTLIQNKRAIKFKYRYCVIVLDSVKTY